ncbi:MAG TPA: hypothetical protein VFP18_09020 [Candidatus Binatia bacterium]|nr:hypothetical protein [Candidatus Binatia bacterium]
MSEVSGWAGLDHTTDRQVFSGKNNPKGIQEVTVRDGMVAALVVAGVLVLRWGA